MDRASEHSHQSSREERKIFHRGGGRWSRDCPERARRARDESTMFPPHSAGIVFAEIRGESAVLRFMDNSEMDGASDSLVDPDDAELMYRVLKSIAVGYGILGPDATGLCASFDSLEKDGLLFKSCIKLRILLEHEMQVTPGSSSVFRFGGLRQVGLSEVAVLVVNEPLGCRHLNFRAILGEHNDTPPLLGMDFDWELKGGVIVEYKNSLIMFHDDPQRAWKLSQGPRRLQLMPLLGQLAEEVTPRVLV